MGGRRRAVAGRPGAAGAGDAADGLHAGAPGPPTHRGARRRTWTRRAWWRASRSSAWTGSMTWRGSWRVRAAGSPTPRGAGRALQVSGPASDGAGRSDTRRPRTELGTRACLPPTSRTSAVSRWPAGRSRSPWRAATTCCWSGSPGAGKTLLARTVPGLLPPLDDGEAQEVAVIRSVAGLRPDPGRAARPALPSATSHDVVRGDGRRRAAAPARPGDPGPSGRAVPRRAGGVRPATCSTRSGSRSRTAPWRSPVPTATSATRPGSSSSRP